MNENKIDAVKYEENNFEIQLTKKEKEKRTVIFGNSPTVVPQSPVATPAVTEEVPAPVVQQVVETTEEISGIKVESPMVGTFYSAPSPTSDPFIKEGDTVVEGQTLCIVEAMKLMNEVKSSVAGKVKKILVKDGQSIKKGQVLVIIE